MTRSLDAAKLEAWQQLMARFEVSGLSVAAFCRQENLAPARFYYWKRRVRQAPSRRLASKTLDIEGFAAPERSRAAVELFIGEQMRVRFPVDHPELIASVLSSLQSPGAARSAFQRLDLDGALAVRR